MNHEELDRVEHICFAVYGFSLSAGPAATMYEWALDWFRRFGCNPDKGAANIGGKTDGMLKSFHKLNRKLAACNFVGVTDFELQDIPDDVLDDENGSLKSQNMDVAYYPMGNSRYLACCIRESLIHDRIGEFFDMAQQASQLLRPRYGIIYRRPFGYGPLHYAICLNCDRILHPFDNNITSWSFLMEHEAFAFLRDVYPWSMLTQNQLDFKIGDVHLKEWISKESYRGKLSPFTDEMMLWTVSDESIPQLRDELWNAGVILDEKRDFEAKWMEYNVSQHEIAESYKTGIPLALTHQLRRGTGISEEKMLRDVLGAFNASDSQVLKVEREGRIRELSEDDLKEAMHNLNPNGQHLQ